MSSASFEIYPGALSRILEGPDSIAQKKRQGRRIAEAWKANIQNDTGATDNSIDVEQYGPEVYVTADTSRDPESAWPFREFGTSVQPATHPGRRSIREG